MRGSDPGGDVKAGQSAQPGSLAAATTAVQRAVRLLLVRQDSAGWWTAQPDGDVRLEAEGLLLREFLGIRTAEQTSATAQSIRTLQRPDGSWRSAGRTAEPHSGGSLSASVLAYLALRLAGDSADAYHMAVAAGWIRDAGGIGGVDVSAQTWLACGGLTAWEDLHVPSPELVYLPARHAAGVAEWGTWSRLAVVSMAAIGALRPVRRLPIDVTALAGVGPGVARQVRRDGRRGPQTTPARRAALRRCGQWLVTWQQRDGRSRRNPAWPGALLALHLLGYPMGHPVLAGGLGWLDSVTARARPTSTAGRSAAARPPSPRDTALAICALADAGLPGDHPALAAAGTWLLAARLHGPGDWLDGQPSGWSFCDDGYPAVPDTALVLLALSRVRLPAGVIQPALTPTVRWLAAMQGRDGSWGRSPSTTAQVVRALAGCGRPPARVVRAGVVWLLRAQQPDGSWPGTPGESSLHATAVVLPALLAAGVVASKPAIARAVRWLVDRQNLDAGWGPGDEAPGAVDRSGGSQAPITALVLAALLAADSPTAHPAARDGVEAGIGWLVRAQQPGGGWDGARSAGRHARAARHRDSIVASLLRPLGTLGRYVAVSGAPDSRAGHDADEERTVGEHAAEDRARQVRARADDPRDDRVRADRIAGDLAAR